jgi:hypothetical protein
MRIKSGEQLESIDVAAWRRELAPIYPEAFLANRSVARAAGAPQITSAKARSARI